MNIRSVESHVRYLNEVTQGATLAIKGLCFGVDKKRYHYGEIMTVDGVECATAEFLTLHVDTKHGRTAPIPDDVYQRLAAQVEPELPDWAGKRIAVPGR